MPLITPIQLSSITSRILTQNLARSVSSSLLQQATIAGSTTLNTSKIKVSVTKLSSEQIKEELKKEIVHDHETFSQVLLRKIREKGMDNAECYTKANVDRRVFSKIISNDSYRPKKRTILSLAIALELSLEETNELLMKAELALSDNVNFDLIIKHFITHQIYDFFLINEVLLEYEQPLLSD